MIERLAEDHANARRLADGARRASTGSARRATSRSPSAGPPRSRPRRHQLRPVPGRPGPGRVPRRARARGASSMVAYAARPGPGGDALRHRRADDIEASIAAVRDALPRPPARGSRPGPRAASPPTRRRARPRRAPGATVTDRTFARRRAHRARARRRCPGPLDERLYDLVEARFRRVVDDEPDVRDVSRHPHRGRPPRRRASRERVLARASPPTGRTSRRSRRSTRPACRAEARFERDLEIHNVRLGAVRGRRAPDAGSAGRPALGASATRCSRCSPATSRRCAERLERDRRPARGRPGVPRRLPDARRRAPVRPWQEVEARTRARPARLPRRDRWRRRGGRSPGTGRARRGCGAPIDGAEGGHRRLGGLAARDPAGARPTTGRSAASGTTSCVGLRAFDGLDADAILGSAGSSSSSNHAARAAAAREIDPDADRGRGRRTGQGRPPGDVRGGARRLSRRDAPGARRTSSTATSRPSRRTSASRSSRRPSTCAASCRSRRTSSRPRFDADPSGIYVVTPDVDGDPDAMREHYRASISNTSIHEAYPGHHLQLAIAARHPSPDPAPRSTPPSSSRAGACTASR